jgi:hypothetical protein
LLPKKSFYLFILILLFLLCIDNSSAYAIRFVTEEDFASDYNTYKDYPLRLLFKKLAESDDPEKREIRNIIILKQVFDPNAQNKDAVPGPEYQENYGIIKEISKDRLRVWVPENDTYMDYYLGIKSPLKKAPNTRSPNRTLVNIPRIYIPWMRGSIRSRSTFSSHHQLTFM